MFQLVIWADVSRGGAHGLARGPELRLQVLELRAELHELALEVRVALLEPGLGLREAFFSFFFCGRSGRMMSGRMGLREAAFVAAKMHILKLFSKE